MSSRVLVTRLRRAGMSSISSFGVVVAGTLLLSGCTIPVAGNAASESSSAVATTSVPRPTTNSTAVGPTPSATVAVPPSSRAWSDEVVTDGDLELSDVARDAMRHAIDDVQQQYGGHSGIAISDGTRHYFVGTLPVGPAWSTSKIPLAIAALRQNPGLQVAMAQAIQNSDNAAAAQLWQSLGDPAAAGAATEAILREAGDPTIVEHDIVRPGFSAFGQTAWALSDQARFAAHLQCIDGATPVLTAMGNVAADQRYGLGQLPGARFKGGWGPGLSGGYLTRQVGLIPSGGGSLAVSVAAAPSDGSYSTGQQALNRLAQAVQQSSGAMPLAHC